MPNPIEQTPTSYSPHVTIHPGHRGLMTFLTILTIINTSLIGYLFFEDKITTFFLSRNNTSVNDNSNNSKTDINMTDKPSQPTKPEQINGKVNIINEPHISFTAPIDSYINLNVEKIAWARGISPSGCGQAAVPKEVASEIYISSGCYTAENYTDTPTIVGLDIKVSNSGPGTLNNDYLDLVYFENTNNGPVMRIAESYVLYSVAPYSDRTFRTSHWVPNNTKKVYLVYGSRGGKPTESTAEGILNQLFSGWHEIELND